MSKTPITDELEQADYSNPRKECDVVMKGGISSGVIYPLAVCKLATEHRLKNIGGASAGAIAAGVAAAAEYARDHKGFNKLAAAPAQLGQNLDRLFQPTRKTRPAMKVLLAALAPGGLFKRMLGVLVALVTSRLLWFLLGFVIVGGISLLSLMSLLGLPIEEGDWPHLMRAWALPAVTLALPTGIIAALIGLVLLVLRRTPDNYFGLANGMTLENEQSEALTPWMHKMIQDIAGRTDQGSAPLTFGDLWGAEVTEEWRQRQLEEKSTGAPAASSGQPHDRQIDLKVMTTDLTEGLPYCLPFEGRRFAFCPECFSDLFPADVAAYVEEKAGPRPNAGDDGTAVCNLHVEPVGLRHLPPAPDLPVLVAVRMSLSFPLLISAVPLYKRDFNRKGLQESGETGQQNWTLHWFSDGGIGSNFPIHFFDSLWPQRPTYGIDLQPMHPDYPESEFYLRPQGLRAQPRTRRIVTVVGFLGRIITTMQNWRDRSLALTPGYSNRIVAIYQKAGEGGMNLLMPPEVISRLAERGGMAAAKFQDFSLSYHKWERYRISMSELDSVLNVLHWRFESPSGEEQSSYRYFIENYETGSFVPKDPRWREDDLANTTELMKVAESWISKGNIARDDAPSPSPLLRMESRQIETPTSTSSTEG